MYPKVHSALQAAGYMQGESQLPHLGKILDTRDNEMREAQTRKEEWSKDRHNVYCFSAVQCIQVQQLDSSRRSMG